LPSDFDFLRDHQICTPPFLETGAITEALGLMKEILIGWETLVQALGILGETLVIALVGHYLILGVIERLRERTKTVFDASLVRHCSQPMRIIITLLAVSFVLPLLKISPTMLDFVKHLISLCFIVSVARLIIRFTSVLDDLVLRRYQEDRQRCCLRIGFSYNVDDLR